MGIQYVMDGPCACPVGQPLVPPAVLQKYSTVNMTSSSRVRDEIMILSVGLALALCPLRYCVLLLCTVIVRLCVFGAILGHTGDVSAQVCERD